MGPHKVWCKMGNSHSFGHHRALEYAESGHRRDPRWSVVRRWVEWIGTATIFVSIGIVLAGLADRRAPFAVLGSSVPAGAPGERVTLDMTVWRDVNRGCNVTAYLTMHHSGGVRYSFPPMPMSAELIAEAERRNPGRIRHEIDIPANAVPGAEAYLTVERKYVCNKFQAMLLPIVVTSIHPVVVRQP